MNNKIFCGSAVSIETQYGEMFGAFLDMDVLEEAYQKYGFTNTKGNRSIKISIKKKRDRGESKMSHYIEVDTWQPPTEAPHQGENASCGASPPSPPSFSKGGGSQPQDPRYKGHQPSPFNKGNYQNNNSDFKDDIPF